MTVLFFLLTGFLGSLADAITTAKTYSELVSYAMVQKLILGAIVGYIYSLLYTTYNFPNGVMCFIAGYTAIDFLKHLAEKLRQRK
ncbi:MAG: hypothetical protein AOA66_1315 [Candidatus Bathyarchaeota archaeon BA2]|nr:MAG: hypothetical protein AOA66_1315 [Candidatus Bathyarchaeota archaeon BA2]